MGHMLTTLGDDTGQVMIRRGKRAVSDEILLAFHFACDLRDFEVARKLLTVLETAIREKEQSPEFNRKRALDALLAGHERLWTLKHERAADH